MRAVSSRGRVVGHASRVSSTATRRLVSRVSARTRFAQRRASPRDVLVRLRPRDVRSTRWVERTHPRRRDAPRAQAAPLVPDDDAAPRTALVVGAGPSGALAALHLSRLGWRVRVLDASPRDAQTELLVVSRRGLAALRDAGVTLDAERDGATVLRGAVRHRVGGAGVKGAPALLVTTQFKGSVVVRRGALARAVAAAATSGDENENENASSVSFEYGKSLRAADFDARVARFDVSPAGACSRGVGSADAKEARAFEEIGYDLLVGADGAESATRALLEKEGALTCERNADGLFAKTVATPPSWFVSSSRRNADDRHGRRDARRDGDKSTRAPNERLDEMDRSDWRLRRHAWPSGLVDAHAAPDASSDGVFSFELTVVAPLNVWRDVRTRADAEALLDAVAPGAFGRDPNGETSSVASSRSAYKSRAIEDVMNPETLKPNGVSVTCSRLTRRDGSAVLVGDAAHSAWPTLGQNMDATLETSAYLGAALAKARTRERPKGSRVAARKRENQRENSTPIWSDENTDAGVNDLDFDVKTALAVYFEEGRAPAAQAFVRLCETGFGSGDVGVKRRFENVCFFAKLGALTLLRKLAPFLFDAPALTKMDDPSWGYDDVEDETRRETGTVFAVVACVVSLFCATRRFGARSVAASLGTVARAVLVGDAGGGEGLAVLALGSVAALTAAFRLAEKRRAEKRRARKGNATRRDASA